jgi:hypothetical protein
MLKVHLGTSLSTEFWQRAIWKSQNVNDIGPRLSMIADWLRDCGDNHSLCASPSSVPLPKRLLQLEGREIPPGQVRLALTAGMRGLYAAVSYCWGSVIPLTTTKESFPDHMRGILIQDLPKTFRDSIYICRQLNIRYLWIDSLCIIQDDPYDWIEEAAKMDGIFQQAHITLAATAGDDSNAGLFHPYVPSFSFITGDDDTNPPTPVNVSLRRASIHSQCASPKLDSRGWTFQEKLLSSRFVQFGLKQIQWQCISEMKSEDGLLDGMPESLRLLSIPSPASIASEQISLKEVHEIWKRVAEEYSSRNFTIDSDRLPALAGLTKYFQPLCQDEPFLGIWQNHIIEGLLWSTTDFHSAPTENVGLPS